VTVYLITAHSDDEEAFLMFEPGPSWIPPTNESTLDRLLRESLAGRRLVYSWDLGSHFGGCWPIKEIHRRLQHRAGGCTCQSLRTRTLTCPATMGGEHEFLDGLCRGCACMDKHWVEPTLQREACPATMGGEHEFVDGLCCGCACMDELQREATQVETDGDGDQSSKGRKRPPQSDLKRTPNKRSKSADPAPAVFHKRN